MISYDDAIAVILNDVKQMPSESVLLAKADDRVLAKPVKAQLDLPRFDQSAMDGIGVRKADLLKASSDSPKVLKMAGEMPAGVSRRLKLK
ncbi:MAG: molybdopterin molybdenumtransferase MoeA, partial [bacterium]|nr:molybdopterin molybdenumtransferase MoeA [bacterium]